MNQLTLSNASVFPPLPTRPSATPPSFWRGTLVHDPPAFALWEKLCALSFDAGTGPRTFAKRLASEQRWSAEFAARAMEEYRRFLLLFALGRTEPIPSVSPSDPPHAAVQIVPSEVVDKVWHLHLLYTHSYWENLCRDILVTPLHHLPADGSGGEAHALDDVYRRTLQTYASTFGEPAPADIWPPVPNPVKVQPRQALAPSTAPVQAASRSTGTTRPSPGGWLFFAFTAFTFLLVLVCNDSSAAAWVEAIMAVGIVGLGVASFQAAMRDTGAPGRRRGSDIWFGLGGDGGDGGSGWSGGCGHHGGSHGDGGHGSHGGDSGGHGCGGHGCGGHGCGGHGCGGGGCGGGH